MFQDVLLPFMIYGVLHVFCCAFMIYAGSPMFSIVFMIFFNCSFEIIPPDDFSCFHEFFLIYYVYQLYVTVFP